jgi:hypothetical protein
MSELRRARSRGSLGMGPRPASEGPPFEAISGSQARMHGDAVRSEQNQNGNRNETEINGTAKDRGSTRATATEAVKTNARKAMTPSPVAFCAAGQLGASKRETRDGGAHTVHLSGRLAVALLGLLAMRLICVWVSCLHPGRDHPG